MTTNSTNNINNALSIAPYQLNIWFGSFLWIIGNIGCIGNMMVFCSQSFRKRAYSIYLYTATIVHFYYFNFVLLTRILQKGYQINIINSYNIICKLRQFSTEWGNVVSFSLFSFATIDRLLSTQRSNKYRRWSNRVSLAYKIVILCNIFWLLLIGHRLILYRIQNGNCVPLNGFYAYYDNYFQVIFSSLSPSIIMFILAYLLIKNIRGIIKRKIYPINNIHSIIILNRSIIHQMDSQLTLMLILQSLITILTYIPYSIELIYTNISQEWYKSKLQLAWERIIIELIHLFSYIFFASSFYVSIITNTGFRRRIKHLLRMKKQTNNANHTCTNIHNLTTIIY